MKIGILETGKVGSELLERHGPYPNMFLNLLRKADPDAEIVTYDIVSKSDIPTSPHVVDGWIITGSKHGVYDDIPWIEPLKDFLREAYAAKAPIVGVCFGHQILAEALGGRVEKSHKGWGCGVHQYTLDAREPWMGEGSDNLAIHAMHQDQVVEKPAGARVIASSEFCEFAGLAYGDTAFSIQPHPEFNAGFAGDLVKARRGDVIDHDVADAGLATLGSHVDNDLVSQWMIDFFRRVAAQKAAA